jgi:formylglycine-generating enzyme required for sulfatase activity
MVGDVHPVRAAVSRSASFHNLCKVERCRVFAVFGGTGEDQAVGKRCVRASSDTSGTPVPDAA